MKKLLIGYSPFVSDNNSYTESFKRILSKFGELSNVPSLKDILSFKSNTRYDLLILNWSDNGIVSRRNGSISIIGVIKSFVKLFFWKLISKKIVFVRHNFYPHNTSLKSKNLAVKLIGIYEKFFDACWVHSGHLTENFRFYVPHPLYQVLDKKDPLFDGMKLPEKYFIIFGRILSYKKIDKLIEVLPDEVNLVVCGYCSDIIYLGKLMSYKKNNVTIIPEYISDELAKDMVVQSSGVVICHSDEDMIVSGSIIFAISVGVPVIAIETPFTSWFRETVNAKMITSVSDFSTLCESMRSFHTEIDNDDILNSQNHFSDQAVRSKVNFSLNKLGLI